MPTVTVRGARVRTCQYTAHSILNDNHSDLKRTSSIIISISYQKVTTFPSGDYSVFFMEDFQSNKDSSDEIIRQFPRGEHCPFCDIKSAVVDFTQGSKVAGLSACPNFVTNGEQAPFSVYKECAQLTAACCTILFNYRFSRPISHLVHARV